MDDIRTSMANLADPADADCRFNEDPYETASIALQHSLATNK